MRGPFALNVGALRFLAGSTLSGYGDWLTTVAMVVLLLRLTGSPAGPAGYVLARVAPRVVGPIFGGVLADRLEPNRVLAACWMVQGALTASLVPLGRAGLIPALFATVAVAQLLNATGQPCTGAIIPRLGGREMIARVNRTYNLLYNPVFVVAPLIGSGVLIFSGPDLLLLIDAGTFVTGALLVAGLQLIPRSATPVDGSEGILAGMRVAFRDRVLRALLVTTFAGGITITALQAVLVLAAADRLGSPSRVGFFYAVVGAGSIAGSLLVWRLRPRRLTAWMLVALGGIELVSLFGFATLSSAVGTVLLGVSSVVGLSAETWGAIDLQERTAPALLGRVTAAWDMSNYGGMLVGALVALGFTTHVPWPTVIACTAAATFVLNAAGAMRLRDERRPSALTKPRTSATV